MTRPIEQERAEFEAWISAPPYEQDIERWADDDPRTAWPGNYRVYQVQLAWCAWNTRAQGKCDGDET